MSSGNVQSQAGETESEVVNRIGRMIRVLRESIRELGLDQEIEQAAKAIPDARDRLSYIGTMTEEAAERSLNAVDRAQPIQSQLTEDAKKLDEKWEQWFGSPLELEDAKELVRETRAYLAGVPEATDKTNKELLEITMAQGFQDLTGQVIKKMIEMIHYLEFEMLQIVLDSVADDKTRKELQKRASELKKLEELNGPSLLNGPQVNSDSADIVNSQDQVDDLLSELGF